MLSVLAGENWFALKNALDRRVKEYAATHGELSIERIYAPEVPAAAIMAPLQEQSLFSAERLVVITELSGNKEALEKFDDILAAADGQTDVIILEPKPDKRSAYYKSLKKQKHFQEFAEPSEPELLNWALDYVKEKGAELSSADARYLIDRVGPNQTVLERELLKLTLYTKKIRRDDIDTLTDAAPRSTIFNLVETAFSGNLQRALKLYDEQRAARVEPQAILGMLVWQMHLVSVCVAAGSKSAGEIAAETGLSSYSLGKAKDIARKMGARKVQSFLELLRDIEVTSKSQTYDLDDGLKYAIEQLAY